jgi:F-type H+-transporting ATPase subunit gamma
MSGAGLVGIKRRIKSVTSTQKITNAMSLIATANLRKVRKKLEVNNKYHEIFSSIVDEFVSEALNNNIYIGGNGSKKKLYICLNSDTGLCGGFNSNVVNELNSKISNDIENSVIISVGQKSGIYLKRFHYSAEAEYVDISDVPTIKEASTVVYKALDLYKNGTVGEVNVIYTRFVSPVRQSVVSEKILPLQKHKEDKHKVLLNFEPEVDEMIDNVIVSNLKQEMLNYMINSKASEQASRMTAMDGATKNANELLDSLNLKYNRERQTAITQEITEIVGGAEALK